MLVQRLHNSWQTDLKSVKQFLKVVKKHKGCCDEVWFASEYGFPPISVHKKTAEKIVPIAKLLRENGIKVSMQLSNTVGHGDYMKSQDFSGLVYKGSKVQYMVSAEGVTGDNAFCWNDKVFRQYVIDSLNCYAVFEPDSVWFDDDLRLIGHKPMKEGCFCDNCINSFNKKHGYSFDRPTLLKAMADDITVRNQYKEFEKEGIADFVYEVCSAFHKLCPNTVFGHQNASVLLSTDGDAYILDAMKRASGHNSVVRPGGGTYDDVIPISILGKYFLIAMAIAALPDYVETVLPEIENLPFTAFGKSHYGTSFETALYLAGGATGMTYSMMMHLREPIKFYERFFNDFSERRKYFETLISLNKKTCQSGIEYVMPKSSAYVERKEGESDYEVIRRWLGYHNFDEKPAFFARTGIPLSFGNKNAKVNILSNDSVEFLTREEVELLLTKPCIADGKAFKYLCDKYDCFNASSEVISSDKALKLTYCYANSPIVGKLKKTDSLFKTWGGSTLFKISPKDEFVVPLARFRYLKTDKNGKQRQKTFCIADAIVKTSKGAKWFVFGEDTWNHQIAYSRKEFLLKVCEIISDEKVKTEILNDQACLILPRENYDGKITSVSVVNPSIDTLHPKIIVRNPQSDKFVYIDEKGREKVLTPSLSPDGYLLKLPVLQGWHIATVICK